MAVHMASRGLRMRSFYNGKIMNNKIITIETIPYSTEALKGHRVVWKIEICYLIRMT